MAVYVEDPNYWGEVEAVFADALALDDPARRRALLEARCAGRLALQSEVESLLSAFSRAADLMSPVTLRLTRWVLETAASRGPQVDAGPGSAGADAAGATGDRMLGHYQLRDRIGAGGMGEVFRARDIALGRDAAVKLLSARFDARLRGSLLQEAEASAKLQHPAIATFYEAGVIDGEAFIAMEYVRGETLRRRLADGPLTIDEALVITRCLLEALEHAHAAGILHRDIKPENIIIRSDGTAKLLDLGIAKPLFTEDSHPSARAVDSRLEPDSRMTGTIGYLAPEQILGEQLDARTDIFQVGVVLLEMLTGKPAFRGSSPFERVAAVLTRDPEVEAVRGGGAPVGLVQVLHRALARDPSTRYPRAAAFLRDLQGITGGELGSVLPQIVAVCELENLTGDADMDWVGNAIAESLRADLARLTQLTVVPRDKVLGLPRALEMQSSETDAVTIGLKLGCGWAIAGDVEHLEGAVRVTIHVVEIPTRRIAATEVVEGPLVRLNELQDRLAGAVTGALNVRVQIGDRPWRSASVEAQELCARARLHIHRFGKSSLDEARVLLERAIAADDRHAEALGALASTYALRSIASTSAADIERALLLADRALAVDAGHVTAHVWKGYALIRQDRFEEAESALREAMILDPANTDAYYIAGFLATSQARYRDALPLMQRAVELDGRRGIWWLGLGSAHLALDQRAAALYSFTRARKLEGAPIFATAGTAAYVGEVLRLDGHLEEARAEALAGIESAERSDHAYRDTFRAHALTVLGRIALDTGDLAAADAAFRQVLAQARGRPRARSCGHFVVQALAGLGFTTGDPTCFDEALRVFDAREVYDFGTFYGAMDSLTLFELACTARALGQAARARQLFAQAQNAGSVRAFSAGGCVEEKSQ